jgi:hypothetical protein
MQIAIDGLSRRLVVASSAAVMAPERDLARHRRTQREVDSFEAFRPQDFERLLVCFQERLNLGPGFVGYLQRPGSHYPFFSARTKLAKPVLSDEVFRLTKEAMPSSATSQSAFAQSLFAIV